MVIINFQKILLAFSFILITACASNSRDSQAELKTLLSINDYPKAIELVNSKEFISEKNNELLRHLERSRVFYLSENYFQALTELNLALDISEKLFTVSVTKKISTVLVNDNSDNYYGDNYEKSTIRFYQSLTHFMLAKKGIYEAYTLEELSNDGKTIIKKEIPQKNLTLEEIKFHQNASKSVLLEWDAYLNSIKATTGGEAIFKDDLLAKLYGAFIHESTNDIRDKQIAKDLYKAAKNVLIKNYNIYKNYNLKYKDFIKEYSKFEKMGIELVEKNYVEKTENQNDILTYINQKLSDLEHGIKHNCLFILEQGTIEPKRAKVFSVPLGIGVGASMPVGQDIGFIGFSLSVMVGVQTTSPTIYFELPEVKMPTTYNKSKLIIETLDGLKVQEIKLQLVNPFSEIANQALETRSAELATKTGVRLVGKHLAALISSYAIYKQQKEKNEFVAMALGTLSYRAANKLIEVSEKADLRSWQTIPENLELAAFNLPIGTYKMKLVTNETTVNLDNLIITDLNSPQIIKFKN